MQRHFVFDRGHAPDRPLAGWAAVFISIGVVDKVALTSVADSRTSMIVPLQCTDVDLHTFLGTKTIAESVGREAIRDRWTAMGSIPCRSQKKSR